MNSIAGFIGKLAALGVRVRCDGEHLRYEAPIGVLTSDLLEELKIRKPEVIRFLRESEAGIAIVGERGPELVAHPRGTSIPLSFAQQRLWFLYQLEGPSPAYNIIAAQEIIGAVDIPSLEAGLANLVQRHEMLRAVVRPGTADGEAQQVILTDPGVRLSIVDLRSLARAEAERKIAGLARQESHWRFTLEDGPLLRLTLLRLSNELHQLRLTMHHIIGDGWSLGILMRELAACYRAALENESPQLPPLSLHYVDFAIWQRAWLTGERLSRQARFWQERLRDAPLLLELPTDRPRPITQSYRGAVVPLRFDATFTRRLNDLSASAGDRKSVV